MKEKEERVDEGRRRALKLMGLAALFSAIGVVEVDREVLMKMLKRVDPREILGGEGELSLSPPRDERTSRKEAELKSLCMKAAEAICEASGRDSPECREALMKC